MRGTRKLKGSSWLWFVLLAGPVEAQLTQRVSIATAGTEADDRSQQAAISADGRFVAFQSHATNLVAGDTNAVEDVFVRDRLLGTTERVSVDSAEAQANDWSRRPGISSDGRYVAYYSRATNLVAGDTNALWDVFVRDRQLGTTERVSVDSGGAQTVGGNSGFSVITTDGRYVAFASDATNLVAGDINVATDVFLHDRQTGTTELISIDSFGIQGDDGSSYPAISDDGRFVAFWSYASNLDGADGNPLIPDVFVRDRQLASTEMVTVDSLENQANGGSSAFDEVSISGNGRFVAFTSTATNLVAGDTNGDEDVFLRDLQLGTTERLSVATGGAQGNDASASASFSTDGRYVVFYSYATNLVAGDTNGDPDVFVRDRQTGTTTRVSVDSSGVQGNNLSLDPSLSADGRYAAFESSSTNLVAGDANADYDIFVHDFLGGATYAPFCFPDVAGVRSCPCGNPPTAADLGCDSFTTTSATSGTGGAKLTASGAANASLANTLVFHVTKAHNPGSNTNLHVFWRGTSTLAVGVKSGFGVRCVAGSLKRIYQGSGTGVGGLGSTNAVDFPNGTQTTDAWTASLMPTVGTTLYYYDSFRDQQGPTTCATASDRFNVSHALSVTWVP